MANAKEDEPAVVSLLWADSDPGEDSSLEESEEEDKGTAEKIARLKAELERLEKGAKADQKAKKKKKDTQKRKAESDEEEAVKKKKRKKKPAQEESEPSEDDSSGEDLFVAERTKKEEVAL